MADPVLAVGIHGATGRMGTRLIQLIQADPGAAAGGGDRPADHPRLGDDVGPLAGVGPLGVPLSSDARPARRRRDRLLDCRPAPWPWPRPAPGAGSRWSSARPGSSPSRGATLERAAERIPLLISPNLSRAVNLLMRLAGEAARALGDSADIEIVERHHHFKKDAPSGTALRLAEIVGRGDRLGPDRFVHGRHGQVGERPRGEIGLHALRTGDNPGEHTVVFGLMGECLELSHRALNRDGFARGALDAAKFLAGKPPRLYTMDDLLG